MLLPLTQVSIKIQTVATWNRVHDPAYPVSAVYHTVTPTNHTCKPVG